MIELTNLSRHFGDTVAVRDLSLRVEPGELFGFLGPNGAGKTTTIRMLTGLLSPTSGQLAIDGHDYATGGEHIRRILGFAPDTPPLYEYLTGRQYIAFVASLHGVDAAARDARAEEYLGMFELADRADTLCKSYSHGMRMKIHLCAVLTTAPKVLLLDEPTGGLDPNSVHQLKQVLREMRARGTTIFLSTHQLDTVEGLCDRVGIMRKSELIAVGPLDELRLRDDETLEEVFLREIGADDVDAAQG